MARDQTWSPSRINFRPLLFNIFLNGIFYFIKDICIANCADDNTPYATNKYITNLLRILERETNIRLDWFTINEMKPNAEKCHLLVANQKEMTSVKLGGEVITNDQSVELLGVKIDKNLNFTEHTCQ